MPLSVPQKKRRAEKRLEKQVAKIVAPPDTSCVECGRDEAVLVGGDTIWPHRPDLARKRIWRCPCGARVGCHPRTEIPLGRPAGPETQQARSRAHEALDALWKAKSARDGLAMSLCRQQAYDWLAQQMGKPRAETHMGWMTKAEADLVVQIIHNARGQMRAARSRETQGAEPL